MIERVSLVRALISMSSENFNFQAIIFLNFYFYWNILPYHFLHRNVHLSLPVLHQPLLCRIRQRLNTESSAPVCSCYTSSVHDIGNAGHSPKFSQANKLFELELELDLGCMEFLVCRVTLLSVLGGETLMEWPLMLKKVFEQFLAPEKK